MYFRFWASVIFFEWNSIKYLISCYLCVQVYGLNFSSKDDADVFATAMIRALEVGISTFSTGSLDPDLMGSLDPHLDPDSGQK